MDEVERPEWGDPPGILTLLDCADAHRAAFEYDWRTRFGCAFDPPRTMSWGEACRLMEALAQDPSSRVAAAMAGWSHPVSREWIVLADLYDAFATVNSKRHPKPYPRPWDKRTQQFGRTTRPQAEVRAALRARGHDI